MFWKNPPPTLNETSRVVINIWLPRANNQLATTVGHIKSPRPVNPAHLHRIGHVSMQTANIYASWWPQEDENITRLFEKVPALNSTYARDVAQEGSDPDIRVCLYSLDYQKIEELFDEVIKSKKYGYVLAGDKIATRLLDQFRTPKGQSCSGLAYELLEGGGIFNLISAYQDLMIKCLITTPENLSQLVMHAKDTEWVKYPETQRFLAMEGEYIPVPAQIGCTIM